MVVVCWDIKKLLVALIKACTLIQQTLPIWVQQRINYWWLNQAYGIVFQGMERYRGFCLSEVSARTYQVRVRTQPPPPSGHPPISTGYSSRPYSGNNQSRRGRGKVLSNLISPRATSSVIAYTIYNIHTVRTLDIISRMHHTMFTSILFVRSISFASIMLYRMS